MDKCGGCGADMKTVPAGTSKKTGKAYNSFTACSANCGWKPTQTAFHGYHAPMPVAQQNPVRTSTPDWDEIGRGKVRHAFWLETFKHQLAKGQFDEAIANKTIGGVIGVYVEKVMGEGRGATAQELFPDPKPADIEDIRF
jgi:hypothetical protein